MMASVTLDPITLSATGSVPATASETSTIPPITLSADGEVIVTASLDPTIGEFALESTGAVTGGRDNVGVAW